MESRYNLFTLAPPGNISPALSDWLKLPVKAAFPNGERTLAMGDYLGHVLATSIITPTGVPAASIFCWDETGEFGEFRDTHPAIWLVDRTTPLFPGEWKAEGYGFTTALGARVARWVLWDSPADDDEAHATYRAIRPTHEGTALKEADAYLTQNLVHKKPSTASAAAFVCTVSQEGSQAVDLLEHTKSVVGLHLETCCK